MQTTPRSRLFAALLLILCAAATSARSQGQGRLVLFGRDSAVSYMSCFAGAAGVELRSLRAADVLAGRAELRDVDALVFLWGERRGRGGALWEDDASRARAWRKFLDDAARSHPTLRIVATEEAAGSVRAWGAKARIEVDAKISPYFRVGVDRANLRRLVSYLAKSYAGKSALTVEPAEPDPARAGIFHPAHDGLFEDPAAFLAWARGRGLAVDTMPRAVVLAISVHFVVRNRDACEALLAALERRGVLAFVYVTDRSAPPFEEVAAAFAPRVVLDTRHRNRDGDLRAKLGIPFLQCMTLSRMSIADWREATMSTRSLMGLVSGEAAGSIEPRVVAGRSGEGEAPDDFVAIPERVERVAARAHAWLRLATTPMHDKRVAMFVGAMGGGTADNKQLRTPESVLAVLRAMREHGYDVGELPADARALAARWDALQVDASDPAALAQLARSEDCARIAVVDYRRHFAERVPEDRRAELVAAHGALPGSWRTWRDARGREFFVVPCLRFGKVSLVGSGGLPAREDESFDDVQRRVRAGKALAPSHNILATRFWLEHDEGVHAVLHWGSFAFDLLLPRKVVGLARDDWPEILGGNLPDIRPFSMAATTFAAPAKRRTSSVLINHLSAPLEPAGLDDELATLSRDLHKWAELGEGALREQFRRTITDLARAHQLDQDLGIELESEGGEPRPMKDEELRALASWLAHVENERIPTSAHSFGSVPSQEAITEQLAASAGRPMLEAIAELCRSKEHGAATLPGDALALGRQKTREVLDQIVRGKLGYEEALELAGADLSNGVPEELERDLELLDTMRRGYARTGEEITNLLGALDGRFVPPGPAGPPERNPGAVPSGRNTVFLDPETLPSVASWELGRRLIDEMLKAHVAEHGAYPRRIAIVVTPRHSLSDYGVAEAQVFHLLGVRPVWSRGRVRDFEIVPRDELARPRVDVVIEAKHHYNDFLETRSQLIDRAVRAVCELEEADNYVRENRAAAQSKLLADGVEASRAAELARASIFSVAPGRFGSGHHDKLFSATAVWDTREQLTHIYLEEHQHVYTRGMWGVRAPRAYERQLESADVVLTGLGSRSILTGRAHYSGGNLSAAIESLRGEKPDYYVRDLRSFGAERIEKAETALRRDFRALAFNRKWLRGMMREGKNGARRIAAISKKALGWETNRSGSIGAETWERIVDVYLRDSRKLGLTAFLESQAPTSLQAMTHNLVEAIRKGYWKADRATLVEIAAMHARSREEHGLRIDTHRRFDRFVSGTLRAEDRAELDAVAAAMDPAPGRPETAQRSPLQDEGSGQGAPVEATVRGRELTSASPGPVEDVSSQELAPDVGGGASSALWLALVAACLLAFGAVSKRGSA